MAGTSPVVQWLRICLPMQGMWVQSLISELRSHIHWGNYAHTAVRSPGAPGKTKSHSNEKMLYAAAKTQCSQNK